MLYFKKGIGIALLTALLILLFTGSVFASDYKVIEVYYEEGDDVVKVDYEYAVKRATEFPRDRSLYDQATEGIASALLNKNKVWIVAKEGNTEYILKYDEMVLDNKTISEAIADNNYHQAARPEHTHELVLEYGEVDKKPSAAPDWFDEISLYWSEIADRWIVDISLNFAEISGAAGWEDVDQLSISGYFINDETGKKRNLNVLLDPDNDEEVVKFEGVFQVEEDPSGSSIRILVKDTDNYFAWSVRDRLVITHEHIKITVGEVEYSF